MFFIQCKLYKTVMGRFRVKGQNIVYKLLKTIMNILYVKVAKGWCTALNQ